jgi:aconitate hydratase
VAPLPPDEARQVELEKGPNVASIPSFEPLPDRLELPVLLKVGDDLSTDEIMPAGSRVLPFRSNIPKISEFCFDILDGTYHDRAVEARGAGDGHAVVGGDNYGQGSSREHAALAPRYLGLRCVIARGFARIHWQNLANFGVLPLTFAGDGYDAVEQGDVLVLEGIHEALANGEGQVAVRNETQGRHLAARHELSARQIDILLAGGLIHWMRQRLRA